MTLIVEDGSIVPGANTFAGVQVAAAFHAETGGLIPVLSVTSDEVTFSPGGIMTAPAGTFDLVTALSIIEVRGSLAVGNVGFGHVRAVSGTQISAAWLETVDETPGATVTVTVYEQAGWWHAAPARLESSLINATTFMRTRYPWAGVLVSSAQALFWPRRYVFINPGAWPGYGPLPDGVGWTAIAENAVPEGVVRCELWLSLADIEEPLLKSIDPQDFLISKSIGAGGINKTFGGKIRLRRYPHADADVAQYMALDLPQTAGPFRQIVSV